MSSNRASFIPLPLQARDPYSPEYFVKHSGITDAYQRLLIHIEAIKSEAGKFIPLIVTGPVGSGRTHLIKICSALSRGMLSETILESLDISNRPEQFVSRWNELHATGGILFIRLDCKPEEFTDNPHLLSRLKACDVLVLNYPKDEELPAIVRSIAERENIRLTQSSIEYLIRRVSGAPLSFAELLAKINKLSLESDRSPGRPVLRDAVLDSVLLRQREADD